MDPKTYFYRKDGRLKKINLDNILLIVAADNYVRVFEIDQLEKLVKLESLTELDDPDNIEEFRKPENIHLIRSTLKVALKQLPGNRFVQINRSYVVALKHVGMIEKDLLYFDGMNKLGFPISKQYYAPLVKKIEIIGSEKPENEDKENN